MGELGWAKRPNGAARRTGPEQGGEIGRGRGCGPIECGGLSFLLFSFLFLVSNF